MNFEVNAHDAPLSRLVFLRADGSTGTLDLHDDNALHDEDEVIKAKHLAAHAVTNGKIAPGAVTDNELAGHAVDRRHLSEELDTELANLKKSCDSISQFKYRGFASDANAVTDDGYYETNNSTANLLPEVLSQYGILVQLSMRPSQGWVHQLYIPNDSGQMRKRYRLGTATSWSAWSVA